MEQNKKLVIAKCVSLTHQDVPNIVTIICLVGWPSDNLTLWVELGVFPGPMLTHTDF